ncbi:hypothetical protein K7432_014725 [Basidiobolus ranarum]|uniref:Uncharacterized protein n=1 Tax=Basidiobolus ranarum TaxID=34480 RepID=A0ABR2WH73_9FUNG
MSPPVPSNSSSGIRAAQPAAPKQQVKTQPPTTEGRWTFHPHTEFPPPKPFSSSGRKTYPSGGSGTNYPLKLNSLS